MTADHVSEPTRSARLCAVMVALWRQWAEHYDLPPDTLVMRLEDGSDLNLLDGSEKALALFRAQHGQPGRETSPN